MLLYQNHDFYQILFAISIHLSSQTNIILTDHNVCQFTVDSAPQIGSNTFVSIASIIILIKFLCNFRARIRLGLPQRLLDSLWHFLLIFIAFWTSWITWISLLHEDYDIRIRKLSYFSFFCLMAKQIALILYPISNFFNGWMV